MQKIYQSALLEDLIERLQRVQKNDKMTKEDADNLLFGAIALNARFIQATVEAENDRLTPQEARVILLDRVSDALTAME